MEQIKEGQYIRTIYGIKRIDQIICGQDVRFDNTDGFDEFLLNYHNYDGISINSNTWKEIIIGEPKERPIDLIKEGDLVNNHIVGQVLYESQTIDKTRYLDLEGVNILVCNDDIKSIVTKEQFSQIEYRIGD